MTSLARIIIEIVQWKVLKMEKLKHEKLLIFLYLASGSLTAWLLQTYLATLSITENFNFVNSFYFVFISYTTIGFGDYNFAMHRYFDENTWWLHPIVLTTFLVGIGTFAGATSAAVEIFPAISVINFKRLLCCCPEKKTIPRDVSPVNRGFTSSVHQLDSATIMT